MFKWLDEHHNPSNGSWGEFEDNERGRSLAVQTGYHMWVMYLYDQRTPPSLHAAIDACLATQTEFGGFGFRANTSACEDIDSIYPLASFTQLTSYRHREVVDALAKSWTWVLANQVGDGGFVFTIGERFVYGNCPAFASGRDAGALFPTWFRLLSLACILKSVPAISPVAARELHMRRSPGCQSWIDGSQTRGTAQDSEAVQW